MIGGSLRGHKQGRGDGSDFGLDVAHRTPHMGKPISPNHTEIRKKNLKTSLIKWGHADDDGEVTSMMTRSQVLLACLVLLFALPLFAQLQEPSPPINLI